MYKPCVAGIVPRTHMRSSTTYRSCRVPVGNRGDYFGNLARAEFRTTCVNGELVDCVASLRIALFST